MAIKAMNTPVEHLSYAFVDSNQAELADISWIPSGTHFVDSIPKVDDRPRRLILVSANPDVFTAVAKQWLIDDQATLEVVWRSDIDSSFSLYLSEIAMNYETSAVRTVRGTSRISFTKGAFSAGPSQRHDLNWPATELLQDMARENVSIPQSLFKTILWRYNFLIDHIENVEEGSIAAAHRKLTDDSSIQQRLPNVSNESAEENLNRETVSKLQAELSIVKNNYNALSRSLLGSLTLKYWNFRRKLRK